MLHRWRAIVLLSLALLVSGCTDMTRSELEGVPPVPMYEVSQERSKEVMYLEHVVPRDDLGRVDKETFIYENVQRNLTLTKDSLTGVVTPDMLSKVDMFVATVPEVLGGNSIADILPAGLSNYLLFEMERTPYKYAVDSYEVLGVDVRTQRVFVDISFTTTGESKAIKGASQIIRGEPDYATKLQLRLARYDRMMRQKISEENPDLYLSSGDRVSYAELRQEFEHYYGSVDTIMNEQRNLSLIGFVQSEIEGAVAGGLVADGQVAAGTGIGLNLGTSTRVAPVRWDASQKVRVDADSGSFSALVSSKLSNVETVYTGSNAISPYTYSGVSLSMGNIVPTDETLVFRFVLRPTSADIVTGYYRAMSGYLVSRNNGDIRMRVYDDAETVVNYTAAIEWFIERLNTAVDTNNHNGLYKLIRDYGNFDKLYDDCFKYTYRKVLVSNPVIVGREGAILEVLDTRRVQTRGKDIDITMPEYVENVLYVIDTSASDYQLLQSKILSTSILVEPTTFIRGEGSTLVQESSFIEVANADRDSANELLVNFSRSQTGALIDTPEFESLLDSALSSSKKVLLKGEAKAITAVSKQTYVSHLRATSNSYMDAVATEVYTSENGNIYASNVVFGLVKRNGVWAINSYKRDLLTGMQNADMYDPKLALEAAFTVE